MYEINGPTTYISSESFSLQSLETETSHLRQKRIRVQIIPVIEKNMTPRRMVAPSCIIKGPLQFELSSRRLQDVMGWLLFYTVEAEYRKAAAEFEWKIMDYGYVGQI